MKTHFHVSNNNNNNNNADKMNAVHLTTAIHPAIAAIKAEEEAVRLSILRDPLPTTVTSTADTTTSTTTTTDVPTDAPTDTATISIVTKSVQILDSGSSPSSDDSRGSFTAAAYGHHRNSRTLNILLTDSSGAEVVASIAPTTRGYSLVRTAAAATAAGRSSKPTAPVYVAVLARALTDSGSSGAASYEVVALSRSRSGVKLSKSTESKYRFDSADHTLETQHLRSRLIANSGLPSKLFDIVEHLATSGAAHGVIASADLSTDPSLSKAQRHSRGSTTSAGSGHSTGNSNSGSSTDSDGTLAELSVMTRSASRRRLSSSTSSGSQSRRGLLRGSEAPRSPRTT